MCRHLPDNKSGSLVNFVRLAEFLADLMEVCFTDNFMSDIRYDTNEKLPDLPKFAWFVWQVLRLTTTL